MSDQTTKPIPNENRISAIGKVIDVDIVPEMEKSYLDYAMSVIVARALPDVRDGLKPVHRRIIYAMDKMGLGATGRNVKSAAVVGEVLKSFHPHGDAAVYMSLVRMAQDFSLRYPLVFGQGNFGSIDGDPPAAMRYTEVRMSRYTPEMVKDIDKETVDMVPNYDATTQEPNVLPTRIPNLLLNGGDGIAVGMATRIPPHNLTELCQALDLILDQAHLEPSPDTSIPHLLPKNQSTIDSVLAPVYQLEHQQYLFETSTTIEQLTKIVLGPDFPTAGEIFGKKGILEMYTTGRGKFSVRGVSRIDETKSGKVRIIITELPYQVNKAEFVKKIADLVRDKKIIGISDLRDESDRHGIRVVAEIRKNGKPKSILNKLYKYTPLQSSYSAIMLSLVNGVPQTLNLRQMLLLFLRHREQVVRRRSIFDLKTAYLRHHILEGFKKALDLIDEVIKTIRSTKVDEDPKSKLMTKFGFTDLQAQAILDLQLRRLSGLERQKIDEEYNQVTELINKLTAIVTNSESMIKILKTENKEILDKYQDNRRTKIHSRDLEEISEEDLTPNEAVLVTITKTGYIKRVPKETYRSQKRGGIGVVGMATKAEDEVESMLSVNTHDDLLYFTNKGRVFKTKVWDVPESNRQAKGQALINLINIIQGETIQAVLPLSKDPDFKFIVLATKNGVVKKTAIDRFGNIRQNGLTAIKLDPGDQLIWAKVTTGTNHIFLVTYKGKCIRFNESDIRPMGRHTRGVRGILLKENDYLVSMGVVSPSKEKNEFRHLLVVTENGVGKRSDVYVYPVQKRGGIGIKVSNLGPKTGFVAVAQVVNQNDDQIFLVSKKAVTLKIPIKNIPVLSRNTKGVILMRFKSTDDKVNALTVIQKLPIDLLPQ
ncbi:MAG: DNA gyrase subunit A [Candidatus Shapirobacteria bacterium]|jgi:DNA gyrase subunit A